jgi:hypothetical protein
MGFFKSVGNFFSNVAAPIALSFIPGTIPGLGLALGPVLAATYSGIKTGVETGSPLAGIGSAAMSFGLSEIGRGIRGVDTAAKTGSGAIGRSVIEPSSSYIVEGGKLISRPASSVATRAATSTVPSFLQGTGGIQGPTTLGGLTVDQTAARTLQGAPGFTSITPTPVPDVVPSGLARETLLQRGVDAAFTPKQMFGSLTDYEMRPATLAGLGFVAKQAGTPLPEPEPLPLMQQRPQRDLSRFAYKGPLQRGEYQYADPESLYGPRDTSTYGYVGAKEGGVMKFQLGGAPMIGGFSPIDPNMRMAPSLPRTGGEPPINIMSPPGGQAEPIPTANFIGPAPINQPPMTGITQTLQKAGQQQPGMPTPSPTQTLQGLSQQLSKDVNLQPPAPLPAEAPMMPQQQLDVQGLFSQQNMDKLNNIIKDLPRKPMDVTFSGLGSIGLAVGGEVPGMEKELPAGSTGPSSTVDMSAVNYGKPTPGLRQRFDDEIIGVYENMFSNRGPLLGAAGRLIGQMMIDQQGDAMFKYAQDNNLLRGLGGTYQGPLQRGSYRYPSSAENLAMGKEDVSKIGYENVTYPGVEKMEVDYYNQGGEVESNQMLQENAFVIPADVVGHIGDGSSDAGAQRLQQFLGMNPQQYQAGGIMAGELQGPGGGMDDLIQTSIEGKQAAAVSPQEFVVPRDIVAELGKGSYDQGSKKLYALMRNVRKFKTGKTEQPAELNRGLNTLMRSAVA